MVIAICGQGMALSSDYIIGVAPGISAKAAGANISALAVADKALALSWITGVVALSMVFFLMRKHFKKPNPQLLDNWIKSDVTLASEIESVEHQGTHHKEMIAEGTADPIKTAHSRLSPDQERKSKILAIVTPVAFLTAIVIMILPRVIPGLPVLQGGDAAGLIGGFAFLIMMLATYFAEGPRKMFEVCPDHMTDGFVFAFKAMGSVLPIAGFFFLGASESASAILGMSESETPSLLFEMISAGQQFIPENHFMVAFGILLVGIISGIDGSGFSGLPLTGALSGALGPVVDMPVETLAAIGQLGAIWTGGGTLIAWSSLIAVAGFARVHILDLVRALTLPVLLGLAISTICAVLFF